MKGQLATCGENILADDKSTINAVQKQVTHFVVGITCGITALRCTHLRMYVRVHARMPFLLKEKTAFWIWAKVAFYKLSFTVYICIHIVVEWEAGKSCKG